MTKATPSSSTGTASSSPTGERLTDRINRSTKAVHEVSGRAVNWKLGVVLTSSPACYAEAISLFWIVYHEIEALYRKHQSDHPALQRLQPVAGIFQRAPSFRDDIEFLMRTSDGEEDADALMKRRCLDGVLPSVDDDDGASTATATNEGSDGGRSKKALYSPPELQAYVDRLHYVAETNPVQLVAYLFAMYGAITGGGAAIQKMVRRAYGLKRTEGVQIFQLDLDGTPFQSGKEAWKEFKRILDEDVQWDESDIQLVLDEATRVFEGNNALVATVQGTPTFGRAARACSRRVGMAMMITVLVGGAAAMLYCYRYNIQQPDGVALEL